MTATPIGSEFLVNTLTEGDQFRPSIALDDNGDFVVAWMSSETEGSDVETRIKVQRYEKDAEDGETDEDPITVDGESSDSLVDGSVSRPDVAIDDIGNFVVVWQGRDDDNDADDSDGNGFGIFAQLYDNDGDVVEDKFQVNTTTIGNQDNASVAMDSDGNFVVTWHSYDSADFEHIIYAQRFDSDGDPQGDEIVVDGEINDAGGSVNFSDVAIDDDGNFVIVWQTNDDDDDDSDGDGDGFAVYAQRFDNDGDRQGDKFQVNSFTDGDQLNASVAMDADGNFAVAWESGGDQDGDETGVYVRLYDDDGDAITREIQVNSFTDGNQFGPDIAMDNDGDFVVTWSSKEQDGDAYGIYAQVFDAEGETVGDEFQVNSRTRNDQVDPAVGLDNEGDFVITWASDRQDGDLLGVYAQPFAPSREMEGTPRNDTLVGTDEDDIIFGLAGDDTISGKKGDDELNGGDDDDLLRGNAGSDILLGEDGDDRLIGGSGNDKMRGGRGADRLFGRNGNDRLVGNGGNDLINGGNGNDRILGGGGNDIIVGGSGRNRVRGNRGRDQFRLERGGLMIVQDYSDRQDEFKLIGSLRFNQLDIVQRRQDAIISVNGDRIAKILDTDADDLTRADFS